MKSPQLSKTIAAGTAVRVLDVRTPGEFENRHIPGAYNVPLDQLAEHAPELRGVRGGWWSWCASQDSERAALRH